MKKTRLLIILLFAALFAVPLFLQKPAEKLDLSADQLVVVSPHTESIRYEFEQAFRKYYHDKTGRKVCIDWRSVGSGGGSDISRYVTSAFTANFRNYWEGDLGKKWENSQSGQFLNPRLETGKPGWEARQAFLNSQVGIGIDVLFGGGQYDFAKYANAGCLVPSGMRLRHPEWFSGTEPILVEAAGGEIWHDSEDRYYGACFSSFGICYNLDRLQTLGISEEECCRLGWRILGSPKMRGEVGIADPSQSGSVAKCFEMLIQREMQNKYEELSSELKAGKLTEEQALDLAWESALVLIKTIGGNAKSITLGASELPTLIAHGEIAAGICIDFYGRSQSQWETQQVGRRIMDFSMPEGATSISADPIGIFRGAPHRELAEMFIDFVMSKQGQRLWGYKVGVVGGPSKYPIHRMPVRRDLFTPAEAEKMLWPDQNPFDQAASFTYRGDWTGPLFDVIRTLVKVMVVDCNEELRSAWFAMLDHPEAMQTDHPAWQEFRKLPFKHQEARAIGRELGNPERRAELCREWLFFFREHYKNAERLAEKITD